MATIISPVNAQKVWLFSQNADGTLSPATIGTGSGTVGAGTAGQVAFYSASGTTVIGDPLLVDNGTTLAYSGTGGITTPQLSINGGTALTTTNQTGTGSLVLSASPTFTGAPLAPTAAPGTNTTQLATTAFVTAAVSTGDAFSAITSGTNASAAMIVGTGASLTVSGSGTINSTTLNGATFAAPGAIGGGTPGSGAFTTLSATGLVTFSSAGAASTNSVKFTGTLFTGGSGTTTFPLFFIDPGVNTAPTTWSTTGTLLGMNAPTGFTGKFIDCRLNGGATAFNVDSAGSMAVGQVTSSSSVIAAAASGLLFNGRSGFRSPADQRIAVNGAANTSGLFVRFTFGTEAANNPAFVFDGATSVIKTADGTGATTAGLFSSAIYRTDTNCAVSSASPAACVGASAGQVAVPTAATTYTVNTTAVTANSEIFISQDTSATAGTRLGVTCNTTVSTALPLLTAKVAATSFTFSLTAPVTNPACFSYHIIN